MQELLKNNWNLWLFIILAQGIAGLKDFKGPSKLSNCFGKVSEEAPNMNGYKLLYFFLISWFRYNVLFYLKAEVVFSATYSKIRYSNLK